MEDDDGGNPNPLATKGGMLNSPKKMHVHANMARPKPMRPMIEKLRGGRAMRRTILFLLLMGTPAIVLR